VSWDTLRSLSCLTLYLTCTSQRSDRSCQLQHRSVRLRTRGRPTLPALSIEYGLKASLRFPPPFRGSARAAVRVSARRPGRESSRRRPAPRSRAAHAAGAARPAFRCRAGQRVLRQLSLARARGIEAGVAHGHKLAGSVRISSLCMTPLYDTATYGWRTLSAGASLSYWRAGSAGASPGTYLDVFIRHGIQPPEFSGTGGMLLY
jgi:hypothetical protein